jgi:GNAT superfamily N-acetyltransferase
MEIRPVDSTSVGDLGKLFGSDRSAAGCWCMWFIIRVKDYHAAGGSGNEASFRELLAASEHPMGLIGYEGGEPVGWCAVGPRSRYARAIKTPTYTGRNPDEDDDVWLIPCLFVRKEARSSGLTDQLVEAAIGLARERGAIAVEAFPLSGTERRRVDTQVGFETVFSRRGFVPIGRPSSSRVMMRLELSPVRA